MAITTTGRRCTSTDESESNQKQASVASLVEVRGGKIEATTEVDAVRIEMKCGLPVILGGPPLKPGDIVRAMQADRDARILPTHFRSRK